MLDGKSGKGLRRVPAITSVIHVGNVDNRSQGVAERVGTTTFNIGSQGNSKRKIRVTKWLIFTLIFGAALLFATWIVGSEPFSADVIFGHGELFLIAAVLTGDAFGRIWHPKATDGVFATVCLGALALILAYSSLEFGNSSRDLLTRKTITPDHVHASIGAFMAIYHNRLYSGQDGG